MRDLTIHELDAELAEQLPARELMGSWCYSHPTPAPSYQGASQTAVVGSGNGNTSGGFITVSVLNGNGNGNFNSVGQGIVQR
jgi:hypothetical protein